MNAFRVTLVFCAAVCTALFHCSQLTGGAGGETTNGRLQGVVYNEDGSPAHNARVRLFPVSHDPAIDPPLPDSLTDTTDQFGAYAIVTSAEGRYNLELTNSTVNRMSRISNITITKKDTAFAPSDTLRKPGSIKVRLPDSVDALNGYVYIPGSSRFTFLRGNDSVAELDNVPAGNIPVFYYAATNSAARRVLRYNIQVPSGDTVAIGNSGWNYSKKIYLNTAADGAKVAGNVYGFPALLRLTSGNFDFSQANAHGADLLFTKADNTPLHYEIERWDAALGRAEVWVKVDTVFGNNDVQYIIMYWGSAAAPLSNGKAVFDTAEGFQGVWHLAGPGNTIPGGYKDATANANNLTGTGRMANQGTEGVIGGAQSFDTIAPDYLTGPSPAKLSGNASFTASFWVKLDNRFSSRPCILDFGVLSYLSGCHFLIWPDYTVQFGIVDSGAFTPPNGPRPLHQNSFNIGSFAGSWMQVVTVYDAEKEKLSSYVNGTLMGMNAISAIHLDPGGGMHIAKPYSYLPDDFSGAVDEVRLLSVPLSKDWIKLDYENQRRGGALVRF